VKDDNIPTEQDVTAQMYATGEPLMVRFRTHERYTQPPVDFVEWVLDQVPWRGDETVLDIGCGTGTYTEGLLQRLSRGGYHLSGDLSLGMLREMAAMTFSPCVSLANADVTALPHPDTCFDVVLANHIFYHVPEIERAVAEIHRVLRPQGRLVAATNSRYAMEGFVAEMEEACGRLGCPLKIPAPPARTRFTLENGAACLEPLFCHVRSPVLESALVFPEAAPAVAYINSLRAVYEHLLPSDGMTWQGLVDQVRRQIASKIARQGEYRVPKVSGVFVAAK
jgi:SAM-dependent methyltransferase